MKSYNQFVSEAYSAREELNELFGLGRLAAKGIVGLGKQGYKFGKYAGRTGIGGAMAGYALAKGDPVGTGLGVASMLPGPLGLMAMGANAVRSLRGDHRNSQPAETEEEPTPTPTTTSPDSKEEREKRLTDMGDKIDKTTKEIEDKMKDWKNPFSPPPNKAEKPKEEKKKKQYKDIRDRDISARASYDPRYDR